MICVNANFFERGVVLKVYLIHSKCSAGKTRSFDWDQAIVKIKYVPVLFLDMHTKCLLIQKHLGFGAHFHRYFLKSVKMIKRENCYMYTLVIQMYIYSDILINTKIM